MADQKSKVGVAGARRRTNVLLDQLQSERELRLAAEKSAANNRFEWIKNIGSGVTMATALGALLFTGLALRQSIAQNDIAEQGQLTSRYSSAVDQLGSQSEDVRLGGIYALQRIMRDSSSDQPTIVDVLSAFVRDHPAGSKIPTAVPSEPLPKPPVDIVAALTVLGSRDMAKDGGGTENLRGVNLADLDFSGLDLRLVGADLTAANFEGASFAVYTGNGVAIFGSANLVRAVLTGANLSGANLSFVDMTGANLFDAKLNNAQLTTTNLSRAALQGTDLTSANLDASILTGARLGGASLTKASLVGADLSGADVRYAQLDGAVLRGANLSGANFTDADIAGTDLTGANLTGASFAKTSMCSGHELNRTHNYSC